MLISTLPLSFTLLGLIASTNAASAIFASYNPYTLSSSSFSTFTFHTSTSTEATSASLNFNRIVATSTKTHKVQTTSTISKQAQADSDILSAFPWLSKFFPGQRLSTAFATTTKPTSITTVAYTFNLSPILNSTPSPIIKTTIVSTSVLIGSSISSPSLPASTLKATTSVLLTTLSTTSTIKISSTTTSSVSSTSSATTTTTSPSVSTTSSPSSSSTSASSSTTSSSPSISTTTTFSSSISSSSTSAITTTTSSSVGAILPVVTDLAYIDTVLRHHNVHRANHSVNSLTWSSTLAESARILAQSCSYGHNMTINGGGYGQNIAAGYPLGAISEPITDGFYNGEINNYGPYWGIEPNVSTVEEWGHMTQVVWKGTTQVGCYTADCTLQSLLNVPSNVPPFYQVCNYGPQGNMLGEFAANVMPPLGNPTVQDTYECPTSLNCVGPTT